MRRDVDSVVLVSRAFDGIGDAVGMRIGFAMLFGFEGEKIICGYAVKDFVAISGGTSFDDGGNMRCVRVDFTAGRNGVITRDHVVESFEDKGEGDLSPRFTSRNSFHDLSNV